MWFFENFDDSRSVASLFNKISPSVSMDLIKEEK